MLLYLVTVNKIQLVVHYYFTFRTQFVMLSDTVFKQLKLDEYKTIVPILFMTARCTLKMYKQLQTLTGPSFYDDRIKMFWTNLFQMVKSCIFTRVVYTARPLQSFTAIIEPILKNDRTKSFVFYPDSRLLVDRCAEQYGEWLDKSTLRSNYLQITGPIKKEEKFHVTQLFFKVKLDNDTDHDKIFNPQVLFATAGATNDGIDNAQIYGVFRAEVSLYVEDCV